MSVDFYRLLTNLRTLVSALEARCTAAEARETSLRQTLEEERARNKTLKETLYEVTSRYENLQVGLGAGSSDVTTAESVRVSVRVQRNKYLALVREIDDCIAKLERSGWNANEWKTR